MSACKCGKPRRQGQRNCTACHAAAMRGWRSTHALSEQQRLKMNARSYLNVYVKRGKVKRQPCEKCGNPKSEPHHRDYEKPLDVIWLCKLHHREEHHKMKQAI